MCLSPKMELSDWNPDSGSPIINYTVPSAVSEQEDIIVADPREVGKNYNQYIFLYKLQYKFGRLLLP